LRTQASITIDVEKRIGAKTTDGVESDVSTLLNLLRNTCKATFFVTGEVADTKPQTVHEISAEGHEVACHGLYHEKFDTLEPSEQLRRIQIATHNITAASKQKPVGFRAPQHRANAATLQALEELEYVYDSSVLPRTPFMAPETRKKWRFLFAPVTPYRPSRTNITRKGDSSIFEVPCSTFVLPFVSSLSIRSDTASDILAFMLLRRARLTGSPIVYYLHSYDSGRDEGKLSWFRRVIHILQRGDVEFLTMRQLALSYKNSSSL
jgi:hypothetical protein